MIAFADSGYYVAIMNPRDGLHKRASAAATAYRGRILTTEYVLFEVANYFSGFDRNAFLTLHRQLLTDPKTAVVPSSARLFEESVDLFRTRPDKLWSLTDCCSFLVMREYRVRHALAFDHHFEQAGFLVIP